MYIYRVLVVLAIAAVAAFGRPASASTITYNFWMVAPNGYPVTDLVLYASDGSQDDVFLSPVELAPSGVFQLTHQVGFEPTKALIVGITDRDKDDLWDIVLFTTHAFVDGALGVRFDVLFPPAVNLTHTTLPIAMQAAHAGDAAALAAVTGFLRGGDAAEAYFDPNGPYAIIQFTPVQPPFGGNVPEPATLALLALGIAGLGFSRRGKLRS